MNTHWIYCEVCQLVEYQCPYCHNTSCNGNSCNQCVNIFDEINKGNLKPPNKNGLCVLKDGMKELLYE